MNRCLPPVVCVCSYPGLANVRADRLAAATACIYTFVFSSLDGFGAASGNWGGYWGKRVAQAIRSFPEVAKDGEDPAVAAGL